MNGKKKELPAISVIIPVYNIYDWLDECMESVVNQTFSDFEVLLINDGSTDGSEIKCKEWERKDSRVRVMSKVNEGPSSARNTGIMNALGEYLVFIDGDDWVDCTFLEKLHAAVIKYNTAIAECDVYRFNNDLGTITYRSCAGYMGRQFTLEEHMKYGYTAIWKCMIKKSLFTEYNITFPNCHSEARAVYPLLLAVGGKVVNVQEGLYYYRKFRPNSLSQKPRVNGVDEDTVGLLAFDYLLEGFKHCNLYDKYQVLLREYVVIKLSDLLASFFYRREKEGFLQLIDRYYGYIERRFVGFPNFKYFTLGGYNLNRILSHMSLLHNPYGRFNFSSIISLMHPVKNMLSYTHKNRYREIMIKRDIESAFWDIMEEVQPQYIFMDFIEERFDIFENEEGYITKSDAFDEIRLDVVGFRLIERNSEECLSLWKTSFENFIEMVKNKVPGCQIILIKNYLSEMVGDINDRVYFYNLDEIRNSNRILKQYYDFATQNFEQILTLEVSKFDYYYTDKKYEYGAVPSHLNEYVNGEIAKRIEAII